MTNVRAAVAVVRPKLCVRTFSSSSSSSITIEARNDFRSPYYSYNWLSKRRIAPLLVRHYSHQYRHAAGVLLRSSSSSSSSPARSTANGAAAHFHSSPVTLVDAAVTEECGTSSSSNMMISIENDLDLLDRIPLSDVRNFCFIAHVDHGKSSLTSRILELTGNTGREAQEDAAQQIIIDQQQRKKQDGGDICY
jgi:hypothetical protein